MARGSKKGMTTASVRPAWRQVARAITQPDPDQPEPPRRRRRGETGGAFVMARRVLIRRTIRLTRVPLAPRGIFARAASQMLDQLADYFQRVGLPDDLFKTAR
jgi:hypothetical protein